MADVASDRAEFVVGQIGPCAFGGFAGAESGKARARNAEVVEGAVEFSEIKWGVMGDNQIGIDQKWEQFLSNIREVRRVLNMFVCDAVDFDEVLTEPSKSPRWSHEPMAGINQFPIHKNRNTSCANARVRVVRCFKIKATDLHSHCVARPVLDMCITAA